MRTLGFLIALFVWLILASLIACIPACPFWLFEYYLVGCFVWLLAGFPLGMVLSITILAAIIDGKNDDGGGNDDPSPSPPTSPFNRMQKWLTPTKN